MQERSGAVLTVRLVIVAALAVALVAAGGSGRAESAVLPTANSASGGSAAASVAARAISAGDLHSCALTTARRLTCWGSNHYRQMRDGTTREFRVTPVAVSGLSRGVTAVAAGARHICALTSSGGVKCWGGGMSAPPPALVDIPGLSSGVTAIAASVDFGCAITRAGGVTCWDGSLTPVDVPDLSTGVTAVAAGTFHRCVLTGVGGVKCWGANSNGQLGDGTTNDHRTTPVDVSGLGSGVTAIAAGAHYGCALTSAGGVKCWGSGYGARPVDVSSLGSGVTAIAAGGRQSCALLRGGGVRCWGANDRGQLGDGTTSDRVTPVRVSGLSGGVTAIDAGGSHTCALIRGGGVKCWGWNEFGQLGDGTTRDRATPVSVLGLGPARATLGVVARSATVTPARVAAVELRCGAQAPCRGTLALTASVNGNLVGSPARRVLVKLGSRAFTIAAGRTQTVEVRLAARGFKLLVRVKRLPARARIVYRQPAAATSTATRTITLTAPRR